MKTNKIKLPFGLDENNSLVHIANVENCKECNCVCPSCQSPLIAAKGKIKQHHFRHVVDSVCGCGLNFMFKQPQEIHIDLPFSKIAPTAPSNAPALSDLK